MLTPAWHSLRPHALQSQLWRDAARRKAVVAGRGSGKTELARRHIVRWLPIKKRWPKPIYVYGMPTFGQARRIAWENIVPLVPEDWIDSVNQSHLTIKTIFGSELRVTGTEKAIRVEGDQIDGLILDECSDQKPGVFTKTFGPMMQHRDAWAWCIGVPKRFGVGAREFKERFDLWARKRASGDPYYGAYTWRSDTVLSPEQLAREAETLDAKDYNEQYGACWESASGQVYYAYSDVLNVRDKTYDPKRGLIIGSDFNVDPMAWVVAQMSDDGDIDVIDEMFVRNTNTQQTLDKLYSLYTAHDSGWIFIGDATGKARRSSAASTDYLLIKNDKRFVNSRVFYPDSNPPVVDRVAAVNAQFCSALGKRRLFVHSRCKYLRKDLESLSYGEGTREIEAAHPDAKHITDALGYVVHRLRPLLLEIDDVPEVVITT